MSTRLARLQAPQLASRFRKPTAGTLPASDRPETWEETVEIADPHTLHTAWAERFNARTLTE
jgi:hypothetical protein